MSHVAVEAVADALNAANYTHRGVSEVLGDAGMRALTRGEFVGPERATRGGSPLETLIRLFLLGETVSLIQARDAIPFSQAWQLGLMEPVGAIGGDVRATLDLRPYSVDSHDWWVVSDLGAEQRSVPLKADHVLGIGGASTTLAQLAPRLPVGTSLDLGTGCGVQGLHLSTHSTSVMATDINPRAIRLAELTFALNAITVELEQGDLLLPVAGRTFDQIVSNPPFVVGSGAGGYTYRDSGLAGDTLSRRLVAELPNHLNPNGTAQMLGNWMHVRGEDWRERIAGWAIGNRCDVWIAQRDVQDPAEYVGLWLNDAAEDRGGDLRRRYDDWLAWFDEHEVEGIGFGFVLMKRTDSDDPAVVVDEITQPIHPPLGQSVTDWFTRQATLRDLSDDQVLATAWRLAEDVSLEQIAQRAPDGGWAVLGQVLRQESGVRWREDVDQMVATLLVGCDGNHRMRELLSVLETAYPLESGVDRDVLYDATAVAVRHLVTRGFLTT